VAPSLALLIEAALRLEVETDFLVSRLSDRVVMYVKPKDPAELVVTVDGSSPAASPLFTVALHPGGRSAEASDRHTVSLDNLVRTACDMTAEYL
jgi:hypothetical protein